MEERKHLCPYCCWYDGKGFCKNPNHWDYDNNDKSCKTIVGCAKFIEIDEDEII